MQYIDFKVQHQTIIRTDSYEVVGGSQNYLYARFSFCAEWADITSTAVFSTNSGKHIGVAIENGECLVPWEVLTGAEFWVGVFGGDRITTSTVRVPVKPGAKHNASPGVQPTPPAYEILMSELRECVANIDKSEEAAESAATQAAESAAEAENAKETAIEALDSFMSSNTPIINNLTAGGTNAALSAEMGRQLEQSKVPFVTPTTTETSMDELTVPFALVRLNSIVNSELWEKLGKTQNYAYVFTYFYYRAATNQPRLQIAFGYGSNPFAVFVRRNHSGAWGAWREMAGTDNALMKAEKPTGSYQGTSSTAQQDIDTKGIGNWVLVNGGTLGAIIGANGGMVWDVNGSTTQTIGYAAAHFRNGILTIATDSFYVNSSTVTYTYQVL